jgi:tetratricopeptide (TPR) repeat protein
LVALSVVCFAAPEVLIVAINPDGLKRQKANVADLGPILVEFTAEEFDTDGRLHPIAWSMTDPYYRIAVESGKIKKNDRPSLRDAFRTAEELKVEYLMTVSVWEDQGKILASATVYKGAKQLWRDPDATDPAYQAALINQHNAENQAKHNKKQSPRMDVVNAREIVIGNTGQDQDNVLHSLGRTWVLKLGDSVFKPLEAHPAVAPTVVDPGPKPITVTPPPTPPQKVDNKDVFAQAMKLLAEHKNAEAIGMLRDAVDLAPLDAERRRALINALAQTGQPLMAAGEARRAASILPDKLEFRVLAARNYLAAGQSDEAMADLKEAVARDPNGSETRRLLGEIDLWKLDFTEAIAQFDFVVSKDSSADAYYDRGLAKCLSGDAAGAAQDMDLAKKNGLQTGAALDAKRYADVESLLDKVESNYGDRSRTLLQHAKAKPDDASVASDNTDLLNKASAEVAFLSAISVPESHQRSSDTRLLALKLLVQCYTDLEDYIKSPNDDALGDATITLGEGLKDLDQVKDMYSGENDKG